MLYGYKDVRMDMQMHTPIRSAFCGTDGGCVCAAAQFYPKL